MGIIDRAARALGFRLAAEVAVGTPFPNDGDNLFSPTLDDLYGFAQHIHVTRERAMKLDVVSKGRRVMAGTIGRMTLVTKKGLKPAPQQPSLLVQPEQGCSLANSLTWLVDDLMFNPKAWWIVTERDAYGWPRWVKRAQRKDLQFDADKNVTHAFGAAVAQADVIEFPSIDEGALWNATETIQRAIAINRAAAHAEDNPVPSIDLHNEGQDIEDTEIDKLIERWVQARKRHGVGYSSKSLKVNALGVHPEQLLIEGRKAIDLALVRHMGIPAWAADVVLEGSSLHYENRASRNWELIDLALAPYMTAITSRLSMPDITPRGWTVEFDTDTLTRPAMKERFDTYKVGIDGGFITPEWIAEQEGWDAPMGAKK